jgi:tetratricopeptide (TPR) repeat protein
MTRSIEPRCLPAALVVSALVLVVQGALPATARAADDDRATAKAKLVRGGELANAGDFQGALAQFEAAYALVPSPRILYNFGVAYQGLARKAEALEVFERFLAEAPDAPAGAREKATRACADLRPQVGVVTVDSEVAGAEILVDGKARGVTPRDRPIYLDPGPHHLAVQKTHPPLAHAERLDVSAGAAIAVHISLPASAAAPLRGPVPDSAAATAAPPPPVRRWQAPAAWGAAGLAAVALGYGIAQGLAHDRVLTQFNGHRECFADIAGQGGAECSRLYGEAQTEYRRFLAGVVAGGALALTSAVLFANLPARPALGASYTPSSRSLALTWRWGWR